MGGVKLPNWIKEIFYFLVLFIFVWFFFGSFVGGFLSMIGILPKHPPTSWLVFSAIISITFIIIPLLKRRETRKIKQTPWVRDTYTGETPESLGRKKGERTLANQNTNFAHHHTDTIKKAGRGSPPDRWLGGFIYPEAYAVILQNAAP